MSVMPLRRAAGRILALTLLRNVVGRALALRLPLRLYRWLTLSTAVSVWVLLVLGGLVRVTESGRGCGSTWPMCNGRYLPALEYHQLIEWNHRLFAMLVGWLMIFTVGATLLGYRKSRPLFWLSLLATFTYVGQALLGAITVWLDLDHKWVMAHMGNSMLLLGFVILLAIFARQDGRANGMRFGGRALWWLAVGTTVWTYLAMLTGSAVIGAEAELACPEWPHCSNTSWLPQTADQWISFAHRIAVGFSDVLMLLLTMLVWRLRRGDRRLMFTTHLLAAVYISQVFLGAFTIWLGAPPALKGAHLALAALAWGTLVMLTTFVWLGPARSSDEGGGQSTGPSHRRRTEAVRSRVPETVRVYFSLIKPRIIPLLLVPTVASMLIAAVQQPPERPLFALVLLTMLGGTLATAGAHVINQYLDRDLDARMRRTSGRALVRGRVSPLAALRFGVVLTLLAFVQLWLTVNFVAAVLAIAGNLFYVFVYTLWLKRTTTQNIVIGGAAGAVPPLVGWAAVTGDVGLPAILFFAIIFFWTPAHFWALALVRQEDYRQAGIPMYPVVYGEARTRRGILRYTVLLLAVTVLPFATHALGWVYLVTAVALGLLFVHRAFGLVRNGTTARAWSTFMFSNAYLALLYLAMVVDRVLALSGIAG